MSASLFNAARENGHIVVRYGESTRNGGFGMFSEVKMVPRDWCYHMPPGAYNVCLTCEKPGTSHWYVWGDDDRWNAVCEECFYK